MKKASTAQIPQNIYLYSISAIFISILTIEDKQNPKGNNTAGVEALLKTGTGLNGAAYSCGQTGRR